VLRYDHPVRAELLLFRQKHHENWIQSGCARTSRPPGKIKLQLPENVEKDFRLVGRRKRDDLRLVQPNRRLNLFRLQSVCDSGMIQLYNVTKIYNGRQAALRDISTKIERGEFTLVAGPSGAGKTTLIKLIMCEERVSQGEILVDGINLKRIRETKIHALRRKIGVVFQDFKLIPTRTVFQNVALRLEIQGISRSFINKKVRVILKNVGLEDFGEAFPPQLSGGEQQRAAIARAMVGDPLILLADEPTGNLDIDLSKSILDLLLAINRGGTTVLMATHNQEILRETSHRVIRLEKGQLVS
jgi:cell division transport system ATP-binding protein